jgi:uncharacterized protein YjbI with pentapeptide repeats
MVCIGMFLGMFLIPSGTEAWNDVQLQQLKTKNHCPNCNLSGAYLQWAYLGGECLNVACRSKANLNMANLGYAKWTDGSTCKKGSIGRCNK